MFRIDRVDAVGSDADARRRQIDSATLAAPQHLGIAGRNDDTRFVGCACETCHQAIQQCDLEALLDECVQRQVLRCRTRDRKVVDGSVHRQRADVAAGKLEWLYGEAVSGHQHVAAIEWH